MVHRRWDIVGLRNANDARTLQTRHLVLEMEVMRVAARHGRGVLVCVARDRTILAVAFRRVRDFRVALYSVGISACDNGTGVPYRCLIIFVLQARLGFDVRIASGWPDGVI